MAKQSKRFRALAEKRKEDAMPLADAVKAIKAYDGTKFDQSIEIAIRRPLRAKRQTPSMRPPTSRTGVSQPWLR